MFFSEGKLIRSSHRGHTHNRLESCIHLVDLTSKLNFLIDNGADSSVLTANYVKQNVVNVGNFFTAERTKIHSFSTKRLTLGLNLRINVTWSFVVSKVNQQIGIDLLKKFSLLVYAKSNSAFDTETMLSSKGSIAPILRGSTTLSVLLGPSKFHKISTE